MASTPCRYKDKCKKQDCPYNHELTAKSSVNPKLCQYGGNCRTRNCTFTHLTPPKGAQRTRNNCKNDVDCTRLDCYYNHPNGRLIDRHTTMSTTTAGESLLLKNSTRPRRDSSQSDTSSCSSSTTAKRNCRFGTKCKRTDCHFDHPFGRDIDKIPTTTKIDHGSQHLSETTLIDTIEKLLLTAEREQENFNVNDKGFADDDNDEVLDALQQNALVELRSQQNEFQSAIVSLTAEFNSIQFSEIQTKEKIDQLQRIQKQLERELKRWQSCLPIYARRSDIIDQLQANQVLILKADTGSGKSTQTVQYLCDEHFADQKQIICTQPRKLAARSLAARVAEEYGCKIGEEVGFQVGGGRPTTSNKTKIKFVTDTLFLNEYQNDSMLRNYSVVIIDEAHERKIDTDIVFGIMKLCLRKRKDLKLVVMSATLDMKLLRDYFVQDFQCGTLEVSGRTYPIEDFYLDDDVENYVQESVKKAIEIHKSNDIGDILVFLTGQDEIDLALAELKQKLGNDGSYIGLPLHGKLSEEDNARIFERIPNIRKIIFSTNVAETSVTIDGIKHVIESGMVKEKMWDEKRKMQVLKIGQITKSSVKQRRGRAGRTSAGKCYHLYTTETYEAMDACSRAEILCTQPTIALLKLKHLNINNIESFDWLEPPSASSVREAYQTLVWLNALDPQGKLTALGRNMARLDIDPKLTAMLYKGEEMNCLSYALILAGMLTVSQNIWWSAGKDQKSKDSATRAQAEFSHESGDHITLLHVYLKWFELFGQNKNKKQQYEWCKKNFVNAKSLQMAQDFIKEKAKQMQHEIKFEDQEKKLTDDLINRLLQCITAGQFLNLAVSNGPQRAGYRVMSAFSSSTDEATIARVFRTSTLCLNESMPKYIVFNELLNLNGTNYITILSSIELNWLKYVSQQWFTTINGHNLHTMSFNNYTFDNLGGTLLRAVVGKRNSNLNQIEEQTEAIIDVDYKQLKLTIWSRQNNLEKAKKIVSKMIEKEREKLLVEAEEIQITGRTRILMGAGGVSQMVLVEDEFIRIIMTKLSSTITEERIQTLCEAFGTVRKIDFIRQNESGSCVAVTYSKIDEARFAFSELNGYIEQGREIAVSGSCLKTEATTGKQNCRLQAIWYLTPSTGNGKIIFSQERCALDAFEFFKRLNYQCRYERTSDIPTLKMIYYLARHTSKAFIRFQSPMQAQNAISRTSSPYATTLAHDKNSCQNSVLVQGFPDEFDEEDMRLIFRNCEGLVDVQVLRGGKGQRFTKPIHAEDDIRAIFNRYQSFQRQTISFNSKITNGRLEAYVEFLDINDLQQAINEMNGRTGLIGYSKVRLSERIQSKKNDLKKKKTKNDDEYAINFQHLQPSMDKYDLIKILKDNGLYDDVINVIVFRQKLDNKNTEQTRTSIINANEQETGLVALRSMFLSTKNLFRSIPDCQISSSTPDGTVTALILFDDPVDVTTAIQTYDGQNIQLFDGASKIHLIPSMAHEIFVNAALTKAIPEKIQFAIKHIRENFKKVRVKAVPSKNTEKAATMKIYIDGNDIQQITMAKIEFENLMKGIEYRFEQDPEKLRVMFDRAGITALQRIQNETQCYIWWKYSHSFIRIYGSDQATNVAKCHIDDYIRETLRNKKHKSILNIPPGHVRQVLRMYEAEHELLEKQFNVEINTLIVKHQLEIIGNETTVHNCEQSIKTKWFTVPADQQALSKQSSTTIVECPICCSVADYYLQGCGHAFCIDCLKQSLSQKFDTTLSNETLEVKCLECDSAFLLRDIKTILDSINMPKLARASFHAYLKTDNDIVQCMGIDCSQVYRKSKHPQSYFCDGCRKIYCTQCEVEYHAGVTCQQYQTLLKWKQEEGTTIHNIGGLDLKPCPSCKQVIDRYAGCNAVKCKCGISFCWLCLKTDPIDIHYHFGETNSSCYQKCFSKT
ncbi:hypothetical protein I4U23_016594 [Adineta vaga]|nr:hypothetical protein I4U23_016594 [Adineta vaga]